MESATFNVTMHSPLMLSTSSSISPSPTALLTLSLPSMRRRLFGRLGEFIRNQANSANAGVVSLSLGHVECRISSDRNSCSQSLWYNFFKKDSMKPSQFLHLAEFLYPSKNGDQPQIYQPQRNVNRNPHVKFVVIQGRRGSQFVKPKNRYPGLEAHHEKNGFSSPISMIF